jgi:hypothetical protein
MERFVHNEYLLHLRKQIAGTTDEAKQRQTSPLLSEEEVKDHLPPKKSRPPQLAAASVYLTNKRDAA